MSQRYTEVRAQPDDSGAVRTSEAGCTRTTRAPRIPARLDAERAASARGRKPEQAKIRSRRHRAVSAASRAVGEDLQDGELMGLGDEVARNAGQAKYVAIITDGNGRWAKQRGLPVVAGHEAGADAVKARLRDAARLGIRELTVYSFSTENWNRSEHEVSGLMEMFARRIELETPELHEEGVRMRFIGRRSDPVPEVLIERMQWAETVTNANSRITLFVAFNYGGRAEILDAARTFSGGDEDEFRAHLYAPEMHDPDLIIRTSGEQRLSNYLMWQSAYSELVFRDELWPDFSRQAFEDSLAEFAARKRRFGGR